MDERLIRAETIVFDVGNVLLTFDPEQVITLFPPEHRAALMPVMFGERHLWARFDVGTESNEEVARRIAREADVPEGEKMVLYALHHFYETMRPLPLYDLLPDLRRMGKRTFALTNYPEPSFALTCRAYPRLREQMDGAVVSARERAVKPDPVIFHRLMERYRVQPEKTLFIDDTAANVQAASQLGFQVWHYAGDDRIW